MIVDLVSATQREDWEQTRQLLYRHWITECPKQFNPSPDQPWESVSESVINPSLFLPLTGALCADSHISTPNLISLNAEAGISAESTKAGHICGHVFKVGELTYMCKDCATDPTCVMCHDCFMRSEHKEHKYKIHASSGHGYCDCGDPDAWKSGYACSIHAPITQPTQPGGGLPEPLKARLTELFSIILQYCTSLVCWEDRESLPSFLKSQDDDSVPNMATFMTVLYNDETHTYENVIRALELFINCTHEQAMLIATIVDREGRSAVKIGTRQECERVKTEIQRRTSRDVNRRTEKNGPLDVKVMETSLIAHQTHAISLMAWTNQQLESCPFLSELIGHILLNVKALDVDDSMDVDGASQETILVRFLKYNRRMWKSARANVHQMLMKTVLMNPDQKYEFAKIFLKYYAVMYSDFVNDDHDLSVSVVSLSVQFMTVPSIAKRLIAEENALSALFLALRGHTDKYLKEVEGRQVSVFDFTNRAFPVVLKRAMHMMRDEVYILNAIPTSDEWTADLRNNFLDGFQNLLKILHPMQGMDEVKRLASEHQLWELEWETAFNIQLRIQEVLGLFIQWASTDREVHLQLLKLCLSAMKCHPITTTNENGATLVVELNGDTTFCKVFDVLHGTVSIHQPLWRMAAGLFAVGGGELQFFAEGYEVCDPFEEEVLNLVKSMRQDIYETPLRVAVLCAQANAQLWRRNGFSLINQIHNYYSPLCRTEMFDRDLQMLQIGAALFAPVDFILHVILRFRLLEWADKNFDTTPKPSSSPMKLDQEENSKVTVSLAEDMLLLFIQICGERYKPGIGKCNLREHLRREVVHVLCMDAHPFSKIVKKMSTDPQLEKVSLNEIVSEVAEFRKPVPTSAGLFYLKQQYLSEYNPFFYHYSKSDFSQAELHQQKVRAKMDRKVMACPPPIPCDFEPFFAPIVELLRSKPMIRLCRVVVERSLKRNRFSSDRLLHRALFLVGMGLQEQERNPAFDYLTAADEEGILGLMEEVLSNNAVAAHQDLVWWTVMKYKQIQYKLVSANAPEVPKEQQQDSPVAPDAKRAAMGAKYREMARQRMMKLQTSFMKNMQGDQKTETAGGQADAPAIISRIDDDEDKATVAPDSGFPVCLGVKKTKVVHVDPRKLTCILCQEDENLMPNQARPFVCAAYVQRSHLFSQKYIEDAGGKYLKSFLVPASLHSGIDASTCSHTMHYDCYTGLVEMLVAKERQRPRQQMFLSQKFVDIEIGEYLCPLCKRLSNAAMPVLPSLPLMNIPGFSSARGDVVDTFDSWFKKIKGLLSSQAASSNQQKHKTHNRKRSHSERSLLDLAKGDELSSMPIDNSLSTSVPSASAMSLLLNEAGGSLRAGSQAGSCNLERMDVSSDTDSRMLIDEIEALITGEGQNPGTDANTSHDENRRERRDAKNFSLNFSNLLKNMPGIASILKNTKISSPAYDKYSEMIRLFCKTVAKTADEKNKDQVEERMRGILAALGVWQSTAHVLRSTSANLKIENKPLFGALNTRQRDCILAMSRLSAGLSFSMQHMPEHTFFALKSLLSKPPAGAPSYPTSPASPDYTVLSPPTSLPTSPVVSHNQESSSLKLSAPFIQFIFNAHNKASQMALVNLLHIDMLSLAVSLCMCIGWTWNNGVQSISYPRKEREMIPDGSPDEQYCIRLCLLGFYFQVIASFEDSDMADESGVDEKLEDRVKQLWMAARPHDQPLINAWRLCQRLQEATLNFLRPIALLYYGITMIDPPEALKDPSLDEFEPLCRYLGLPSSLSELLSGLVIEELFDMWSKAIPPTNERNILVRQPIQPNILIDLPEDFSEVIQCATSFKCPTVPFDETASNVPTLCLVCGEILCSQSYCCQKTVGKESVGACRYHMSRCSGSMGIFLRIRDCAVVLMTSRTRGCFRPAPYVDEFGETDQGFRRGNPLRLNAQLYQKLHKLWLTQGISEEIVNQYEIDPRNLQYDWAHF